MTGRRASEPAPTRRDRVVARLGGLSLAVALAVASVAPGCGATEETPVTTVESFERAVLRRDAKAVLELADAEAVADLEKRAADASAQVGGRQKVEPHEMFQIVDPDTDARVTAVREVSNDGETAQVVVETSAGESRYYTLFKQEDGWRVQIPRPGVSPTAAADIEPPTDASPS